MMNHMLRILICSHNRTLNLHIRVMLLMPFIVENVQEMERFLILKRKELEGEAREIRQKLQFLDSTLKWMRKDGNLMDYNVTLKTLPERYVASVRQVIAISFLPENRLP